jgi:transposase
LYGAAGVAILSGVEDALAILQAENATLRAQLAERDAALDAANAQIEALSFNLAVLRRRQFGQSSERLAAEIEQLELRLEDLEESRAEQSAKTPTVDFRAELTRFFH